MLFFYVRTYINVKYRIFKAIVDNILLLNLIGYLFVKDILW